MDKKDEKRFWEECVLHDVDGVDMSFTALRKEDNSYEEKEKYREQDLSMRKKINNTIS